MQLQVNHKIWNLKNVLAPKNSFDPPAAKIDKNGNLLTDLKNLESLYLDTYVERLKPNQMPERLSNLENLKEYLFELRYTLQKKRNLLIGIVKTSKNL